MAERLNSTLQENVITLLSFSDEHGKLIANMIDPALFEGDYRVIAERAVTYWQRHREAPKLHTADLVADILEDPHNRKAGTYRRILDSMHTLSEHVNADYVLGQLRTFTRLQRTKDAILKSAERINAQQEIALVEIEDIWNDLLKSRELTFEPGTRLYDIDKLLKFMESVPDEFVTGITALDRANIVPRRGTIFNFLGAASAGKTWFLTHVGKHALLRRMKVAHVSLEIDEEEQHLRYLMALFAVTKRAGDKVMSTTFKFEREKFGSMMRLSGFDAEEVTPDFNMQSPYVRTELEQHLSALAGRVENLRIKRFPSGALTARGLEAYLDNLEATEGFIPDMVIVDYPRIMKIPQKDFRLGLGQLYVDLRGLFIERNVAGVVAHQLSRAGAEAAQASNAHISEDWSIAGTCDTIVVFSRTEAEAKHGLGRLFVSKARAERDKFGILMTQSYATGQFCLDSVLMEAKYFDHIKSFTGDEDEEQDDGDSD